LRREIRKGRMQVKKRERQKDWKRVREERRESTKENKGVGKERARR
jgi:hypothetical protein